MRTWLRSAFEAWQHRRLRRWRAQVAVDRSSRLLRRFSVTFLTAPAERLYLKIGARCLLNVAVVFESIDGAVDIGDRVYIGHGGSIISRSRISIGNDVTMAWGVTIYDHNSHSFDWRRRQRVVDHFYRTYGTAACFDSLDWSDVAAAPIVIGDRVWIGFDVVILKGVTIGEGAVIGARSVVSRDVEPYTVVAGNPARVVRRLESRSLQESPSHAID
jgi:galactoside O-acetyltransferase